MNMIDRLTFKKIMGDEESELFEISITSRNNEGMPRLITVMI